MEIESDANWARVTLSGDIDLHWVEQHQEDIEGLCTDGPTSVALDLAGVTFMDSTGLGLISRLCHVCGDNDGHVYVISPSKMVRTSMEIVGLMQTSRVVMVETPEEVAATDALFTAIDPQGPAEAVG